MACEDTRQLTEAQRTAGYQQQRTGVPQAVRPFTGRPTIDNLLDYINRELVPAVRQTRSAVNETYNQVRDNAPSGNPLQFYFSTETANADPTTGYIRLDAATQDTATTIRVSQTNGRLQDVAAWLDVMAGGATTPLGTVTLFDSVNPGRFIRFDLNTIADQGAYWNLGVSVLESSHDNPFVEGGGVVIAFIPGVAGAGATVPPSAITPIAANTVVGNATALTAAPAAIALSASTLLGRRATGNITALTGVQQGEIFRRETVVVDTTSSGSSATYTVAAATTQIQFKLSGALTIHGMTATSATFGKTLEVSFEDGFAGSVTFANESASAGAALDRIRTPGAVDFVLLAGETCILTYFDSRWRITGVGKPARRRLPGDPIYDVMDAPFNAAGDGVADDTAAINAAIAAANAVPGDIYFGPSHLVTGALTAIADNCIELIGRGMHTDGTTITTTQTSAFSFTNGAQFSGIRDMRIVGPSSGTGYGLLFQQAFRCFAENVRITGFGNGVEIDRCNTTYIENVDVIEPTDTYGFHVHGLDPDFCHVTRFVRCQVGGSGTNYIGFGHGSFAHTVLYHECGVLQGSMGMHMFDDQGSAPTFVHAFQFSTDHPNDCGILIDACEGAVWFDQTLVTSVLTGGVGIETGADAQNYQFRGGQIYGTGQHGFIVGGSGAKIQGMDITAVGADGANTYDAISITAGVTDFSIVGCSIGNVPGTSGGARYGINIGAGCDHFTVIGNIIRGSGTSAILNTPGRASTRVVLNNDPDVTIASGSVWGLQVDATGPAVPVEITGLEQGENLRRETVVVDATSSGSIATYAIVNTTTQVQFKLAGAATIHGMTASTATFGKTVEFSFDAGFAGSVTFANESASAGSALQRIRTPDGVSLTLSANQVVVMTYFDSRWRVVSVSKSNILTDGDKGDVTVSASGVTWTIDNDVVSDAKLRNSGACSVIGRSANSEGDPGDISATTNDRLLARTSDTVAFQQLSNGMVPTNTVGIDKLVNQSAGIMLGRAVDGGSGAVTALTGVQQGQNLRRETVVVDTTSSGTSATYTIANTTTQVQFKLAGALTINGMTATSATFGKTVEFSFDAGFAGSVTWNNESGSAGASLERIRTPDAVALTISAGQTVTMTYFDSRWRVVAIGKLNALSDIAQSRFFGRAEGAGTGQPGALTPTQAVAIIDGEDATWTGVHTFNGSSLTANVTTADVLLGAAVGGVGLFSGQATANVTNGDLVLNSASGIAINATGSAVTAVGDGTVDINGTLLDVDVTTVDIDATGNVTLDTPGNITIATSSTGNTTVTGGSNGLILTATSTIDLNSPHRLNSTTRFTSILTSSLLGDVDDLDVGTVNVVRLNPNAGARRLRGMAAGGDGQLLLLLNTSTTLAFNIIDESDTVDGSSSAAANRFRLPGTTTQSLGPNGGVWMWYDGTTDRWRMV